MADARGLTRKSPLGADGVLITGTLAIWCGCGCGRLMRFAGCELDIGASRTSFDRESAGAPRVPPRKLVAPVETCTHGQTRNMLHTLTLTEVYTITRLRFPYAYLRLRQESSGT